MARRVAVALLFLLLGCAGREAEESAVRRRLAVEPSSLNPILAQTADERLVAQCLFSPLLYLNAQLQPVPGLATLTYATPREFTFRLLPATFSDGVPVRPQDVLFTLRHVVDPATRSPSQSFFSDIDLAASRVVDERSLLLVFKEARPGRLIQFATLYVIPEHVYGASLERFDQRVVGSGPYELTARGRGKIDLHRRASYWREPPPIARIHFRTVTSSDTAWNAIRSGELDETEIATETWRQTKDRDLPLVLHEYFTLNYNFIAYNLQDPLLRDREVRLALARLVDVPAIIENLYGGGARRLTGPFIPGTWAYDPEVPAIDYDVAAAREVLKRKSGGKRIALEFLVMSGSSASRSVAEILHDAYAKAGVDLKIVQLDPAMAISNIMEGKFQITSLSWNLDADPDVYPIFHSSRMPPQGQNFVRYADETVDRLLEQARRELDPQQRQRLFHQIHGRLAADQPYTWLFQVSVKHAFRPRLQNVQFSDGYGPFLWYPGELGWRIGAE
jgi:peptide/nickel transport system substrate-binding protein